MADFCFDCTAELWEADNGPRNDMVHEHGDMMALCEGCGWHAFNPAGHRRCGRPQTDFTEDADAPELLGVACAACFPFEVG